MATAERITFAIGDIHGCHQALIRLLAQCRDYAAERPCRYIFIGDYIDRGPDSRSVIATVRALAEAKGQEVVWLLGNHEALLLEALETGDPFQWLCNNGDATLESYGVSSAEEIPEADIAWLNTLCLFYDDGQRFYVHAGIDPREPLGRQSRESLLWMREPFLSTTTGFGRLVVHGHTPQRSGKPDLRRNRVNIDTACVYGGVLTAAVFTEDQRDPVTFLNATA
jgi:serine/threonine protein phosphatase 1